MTNDKLFEIYKEWLGHETTYTIDDLLNHTYVNLTMYEDDNKLIDHLYYIVPDFYNSQARFFIFYEVNEFLKDKAGNMELQNSWFAI